MALTCILAIQFVSCSNNEQNSFSYSDSASNETELMMYANLHNFGLNYIKSDVEKTYGLYTKKRLDSVFCEFVNYQYGKNDAGRILKEIDSMKELLFSGNVSSLLQTRGSKIDGFTNQVNALALDALNECMTKISDCLSVVPENELLDNKYLLDELHAIINKTYIIYANKCNSDVDSKVLVQTLGVLYGSIEYWTNSYNVSSWVNIKMHDDRNTCAPKFANGKDDDDKKEEEEDDEDKKLPMNEWIEVVAAADATGLVMGSPVGGGIGAGALAVAASAAVAIYYDVEE